MKSIKIKTTIFATVFLFLVCSFFVAAEDIIISQVLYDPINSETYGEAVELYNPAENTIEISNCIIKTSSSDKDATIPANTFMEPNTYFFLTDTNFNQYKDNQSWPSPDYQEAITLTNSNAGVALICNNQTIDALGWGNVSNPSLYETLTAHPITEGKSLSRINLVDTNNNQADFAETTPNFRNSTSLIKEQLPNQTSTNETQTNQTENTTNEDNNINLTVNVNNSAPKILSYSFSEDVLSRTGFQILPTPNNNKTITLSVLIEDTDTTADIEQIQAIFNDQQLTSTLTNINQTTLEAKFSLQLPFYLNPTNHTISISVKDKSNEEDTKEAVFEYLPLLALEIDTSNLNFDELQNLISGDQFLETEENPTVLNAGNTPLNLALSALNFTSGQNKLPASILKYSLGVNEPNIEIKNNLVVQPVNLAPANLLALNLKIDIPQTAVKGSYTTKMLVSGVAL